LSFGNDEVKKEEEEVKELSFREMLEQYEAKHR